MDPTQGGMQMQMDPQQQQGDGASFQGAPQGQPGASPMGGPAASGMQPQPSMGTYGADQDTPQQEQIENFLDYAFTQANLAKSLKNKKLPDGTSVLTKMGQEVVDGYLEDEASRKEWLEQNKEWLKMAMLVRENKVFPWPRASNVHYPLLATAAMQFVARAYPALVPTDGRIVKTKVVQPAPPLQDPTPPPQQGQPPDPQAQQAQMQQQQQIQAQQKIYEAAERVSQHMSYQILQRIPNWEEDMDKLLMTMAISGICFKKTYYDSISKCNHSHIIYPEYLCVNYYAKNLAQAYRKTELQFFNDNEIAAKQRDDEHFLKLDLGKPSNRVDQEHPKKTIGPELTPPPPGKATPHTFLACHTYWDLDDDGYEEPYIITVHKETKQVVRVVARWAHDGVHRNSENKIVKIDPMEYYTAFPFIPNPDGSIYAMGFGLLLGSLNAPVDTIINQLIDAGTISNLQSGFIGKGLRLKMGQTALQPGEWKVVNATGEDLQKSIYPLPVKEPSNVLFQLLNMLIQSGNQLASIAEIFVGKMPGQNTPATTTQETIQQGMAVFTAIYKRVYRSLTEEYRKLYFLNKICPDIIEEESKLCGVQLQASDYDLPEWVIVPGADPAGDSTSVRQAKLQQVGSLLQMGTIDPLVFTRMVLDANEVPNAQQLMRVPQPQQDPKMQTEQMKQQTMQMKAQSDQALATQKLELEKQKAEIKRVEMENKVRHEEQMQAIKMQGAQMEARHNMVLSTMEQHFEHQKAMLGLAHTQAQSQQQLQLGAQQGDQKLAQADEAHAAKLKQAKETKASKPK